MLIYFYFTVHSNGRHVITSYGYSTKTKQKKNFIGTDLLLKQL